MRDELLMMCCFLQCGRVEGGTRNNHERVQQMDEEGGMWDTKTLWPEKKNHPSFVVARNHGQRQQVPVG